MKYYIIDEENSLATGNSLEGILKSLTALVKNGYVDPREIGSTVQIIQGDVIKIEPTYSFAVKGGEK